MDVSSLMPTILCPECEKPTPRQSDSISEYAFVNYYLCDRCGTVWNTPKNDPKAIRIVSRGPSRPASMR